MELYGNQIHCFDEIDRLTVDFILSKNEKPVFNKLENIGYVFYGPLIFYFMVWMINNLYKNKADKVFFNTREGYFLLKSYEFVKTIIGSENLPIYNSLCFFVAFTFFSSFLYSFVSKTCKI